MTRTPWWAAWVAAAVGLLFDAVVLGGITGVMAWLAAGPETGVKLAVGMGILAGLKYVAQKRGLGVG